MMVIKFYDERNKQTNKQNRTVLLMHITDKTNTSGSCRANVSFISDWNPIVIPVTSDLLRVRTRCPRRALMCLTSTCRPGWPMGTIACRPSWVLMGRSWAAWSWCCRSAPTDKTHRQLNSDAANTHTRTAELHSTGGFRFLKILFTERVKIIS